ncbi:MAG: glycosyltransferase family 39 protein [Planctomycetota bacterium]|nr:glycosyltransferase family 39 protein [Planctomycetota bacterium]
MREVKPSWVGQRTKWILATILTVAALGRVGAAIWLPAPPTWPDGERYNAIAHSILSEGAYPASATGSAPLHPIVLAAIYGFAGENGTAARLLTAVFGTLTCWVVFRLGRVFFDDAAGLTASAILAVYPLHVYISACYEYPQAILILLLTSLVLIAASLPQRPQRWDRWTAAGLLLGLAILAVPTVGTLAPLLAVWLLAVCRFKWTARLARVAVLMAACSSVLFAWSGYWYHLTDKFQLVPGRGGEALFSGNCPLAWDLGKSDIADVYAKEGCPPERRQAYAEYLEVEKRARQFAAGPERSKVYCDAVGRFFAERPTEAIALLMRKAALYWLPYSQPVTRHGADTSLTRIIQTATFVPIAALALIGVVVARSRWRALMVVYLVILSQWLTYTALIVNARYRSHVDVFLIVLAAAAVHACFNRVRGVMGPIVLRRSQQGASDGRANKTG